MRNTKDNMPRVAVLVGDHGICGYQPLVGIERVSRADAGQFLQKVVLASLAMDEALTQPTTGK
jgi:hypothetical protein